MIECSLCHTKMVEGSLYCENCGAALWDDTTDPTDQLADGPGDFIVKSGWGTATFDELGQVVMHIQGLDEPVLLTPQASTLIGRKDAGAGILPDLDLSLYGGNDKGVSRKHAIIERANNVLSLIDLGSANGTYLNGVRLAANQPRVLRDGDEIRLGKLSMHIYYT